MIRALLAAWRDSKIQEELNGVKRTKPVYEKIASRLQDVNSTKTWSNVKTKLNICRTSSRKLKIIIIKQEMEERSSIISMN